MLGPIISENGPSFFAPWVTSSNQSQKQEGQEALNRSPEFCSKLTYRYLLKADHVPGDTWGRAIFGPRGKI